MPSLECGDLSPLWSDSACVTHWNTIVRRYRFTQIATLCSEQSGDKSPHSKEAPPINERPGRPLKLTTFGQSDGGAYPLGHSLVFFGGQRFERFIKPTTECFSA